MRKFITSFIEITKPYAETVEDPFMRDIARIGFPLFSGILFVWLVSLPFNLIGELITAVVKIATTVQ